MAQYLVKHGNFICYELSVPAPYSQDHS